MAEQDVKSSMVVYEEGSTPGHSPESKHTSELSRNVTLEKFERAFDAFLEQADKNAITKKANGGKKPFGFIETIFDGEAFDIHFGQGAASKAPYLHWWVLSIYYIVKDQSIVMGIEKSRYPHIDKLKPSRYKEVPGKEDVAVFYSATRDNINYPALYERFITLSEEIMRLSSK